MIKTIDITIRFEGFGAKSANFSVCLRGVNTVKMLEYLLFSWNFYYLLPLIFLDNITYVDTYYVGLQM